MCEDYWRIWEEYIYGEEYYLRHGLQYRTVLKIYQRISAEYYMQWYAEYLVAT